MQGFEIIFYSMKAKERYINLKETPSCVVGVVGNFNKRKTLFLNYVEQICPKGIAFILKD